MEKETRLSMTKKESDALTESGLNSSQVSAEEKLEKQTEEMEEVTAEEKESKEDEPDYPTGMKLTIITISLCLSVFLVALVSRHPLIILLVSANRYVRTTPSSPPPFPESPIISRP